MKNLLVLSFFIFVYVATWQLYGQSVNWTETYPAEQEILWQTTSMSPDGSVMSAGVYSGRLYISTNDGSIWNET